ncbi:hypothetical protein C2S51_030797 [Perilla frutescens var. frutescens]|nr:hypothetical protein C2S51_030797 [Perilla frutescens var. frutescens]
MARLVLKYVAEYGYTVTVFIEEHTHTLVSDQFKKYLKANRKLGFVHQNFILDCHRANIGLMSSYRLFKEVMGTYNDVGCTGNDYRNFSRDLHAYIFGCDAQMMLNTMFMRKEASDAFFFDYSVDKDDNLKSIFWADPISRRNYVVFGDVVSFNCT